MIAKRITYIVVMIVGLVNVAYDIVRDVEFKDVWWFILLNILLLIVGVYLFVNTFVSE